MIKFSDMGDSSLGATYCVIINVHHVRERIVENAINLEMHVAVNNTTMKGHNLSF